MNEKTRIQKWMRRIKVRPKEPEKDNSDLINNSLGTRAKYMYIIQALMYLRNSLLS
jgi:hypothetical protein